MTGAFHQPTVMQRLRSLLASHGLGLGPCAQLREALDARFALLHARRAEPAFWQTLQSLLRELVEAAEPVGWGTDSPRHAIEMLQPADIDVVVAQLQAAIAPGPKGRRPGREAVIHRLGAPAALCVLLLTVAAGCGSAEREACARTEPSAMAPEPSTTGASAAPFAQASGSAGAAVSAATAAASAAPSGPAALPPPLQDVYAYVDGSNIATKLKGNLKQCLRGAYEREERESLLEIFRTRSPEDLAKFLEQLASGERCDEYFGRPGAPKKDPPFAAPVPLYKGVSFPADVAKDVRRAANRRVS